MRSHLKTFLVIALVVAKVKCKDVELPLCPTNVQYFPQNLPMHCRMPPGVKYPSPNDLTNSAMPPYPPAFFPVPPADKQPIPMPFPVPPGLPGPPGPGPIPMPLPMPIPAPAPAHKLPVIVMPFYSPDPAFKKHPGSGHSNRKRIVEIHNRRPSRDFSSDDDTSTDTSSEDTSSEGRGWWKGSRGFRRNAAKLLRKHKSRRHRHSKKDLLTPILQYVTKDGYVIFEKKISKNEASDWLSMKKEETERPPSDIQVHNFGLGEPEANPDVELLDDNKNTIKEQIKVSSPKIVSRKHHPHRMKQQKLHHPKEVKEES